MSLRQLSTVTKLSLQQIRTAIKHLIVTQKLTQKSTQKPTQEKNSLYLINTGFANDRQVETNTKSNTESNTEINTEKRVQKIKNASPPIDFKSFCTFFNKEMDKAGAIIPHIRSLSPARETMLKARAREHGKASLATVVRKAAQSDFLNGNNNHQFVASFDWLFRPNNFPKVLDGNYDTKDDIINNTQYGNNYANNLTIQQQEAAARQREYAGVMRELLGASIPYTDTDASES